MYQAPEKKRRKKRRKKSKQVSFNDTLPFQSPSELHRDAAVQKRLEQSHLGRFPLERFHRILDPEEVKSLPLPPPEPFSRGPASALASTASWQRRSGARGRDGGSEEGIKGGEEGVEVEEFEEFEMDDAELGERGEGGEDAAEVGDELGDIENDTSEVIQEG